MAHASEILEKEFVQRMMKQLWRANIEGFYTTSPLHVIARALMRSSWFQCLDTEGHTSGDRVILISEN